MRIFMKSEFAPSYDPVFGNNDWSVIKQACQSGNIPATWLVGDTKTFVGTDGNTYTVRLSDKQAGRYTYADGNRVTHGALELLDIPTQNSQWNSSNTNVGGYAESLIRKNLNGYAGATLTSPIIDILPNDLKSLLEEVLVSSSTGGSTYTGQTTSGNKIFLLAKGEVTDTSGTPQYQDETKNGNTTFGRYDYYAAHDNDSSRIKNTVGTTSGQSWCLRSPYTGTTSSVSYVYTDGYVSGSNAIISNEASFAWAW